MAGYGPDARATYFPADMKFDPDRQVVKAGLIVAATAEDLAAIEAANPKTHEQRLAAIEAVVQALTDRVAALEKETLRLPKRLPSDKKGLRPKA